MAIGERMRYLREEKGFSLKKVEMLTGIDNGNLSRYERNLNVPNIEICMQLAKLYGVSLDELVGQDEGYIHRPSSTLADADEILGRTDDFGSVITAPTAPALTDNERDLLEWFRALPSEKARASFLSFIRSDSGIASKRN